jgi:protein TonB
MALQEDSAEFLVDYVMVREKPQLRFKERNPRPPPPPDSPPPEIVKKLDFDAPLEPSEWTVNAPVIENITRPEGPGLVYTDGEYLPIVQVQPVYPRIALIKGLAGWVLIEFNVTAQGTVEHPFVVSNCAVVQVDDQPVDCKNHPNSIFDKAALKAANKFKYKPRVINGLAMATSGVRNIITFELDN